MDTALETSKMFLINFTYMNGYYTIPVIAGTGFVLNLICLVILLFGFKERNIFKYVISKVFFEMISCLLGIGFQNLLCFSNCVKPTSLFYCVYRKFFQYVGEVVFYTSGFIEIFLTYDRYLILKNRKNWFNRKGRFKYVLAGCFLIPAIIFSPDNFTSIEIANY